MKRVVVLRSNLSPTDPTATISLAPASTPSTSRSSERTPMTFPRFFIRFTPLLGLILLLPLTGCDHLRLMLNLRTSLAKVAVTSMEPSLPNGPAIAPGEKLPLVVTFVDDKGKVWTTEGAGKGRIQWRDIAVTPTVVTYKKGVLSLPYDPRVSEGKTGHVSITLPTHPTIAAQQLDIPLTYAYPFVAHYVGASGSNGTNGTDGTAGSSGSDGSTDPNNPSPGGNGGNGTDGTNGGDGSDGGNGPALQVYVTLRPGASTPLLQVGITAQGYKEHFYLINPQGGSLTISSDGGAGGSGGRGGSGGAGGSGGSGSPPGSSGSSGSSGNNGSDGSDGSPGPVTITYDPLVQAYLSTIQIAKNRAGKVTFNQQTVAALW